MDDIVAPPTATQDAIPALADDLLKDRIRQFLEFLDDEVSPGANHSKGVGI
jgi:DNA replication licensing factor MCM3